MKRPNRLGVTVLLLVVSAVTVAFLSPDSTESSSPGSAPGTAGMRVYMDPETGDLTSDAAAVIDLDVDTENALRYDMEGLEVEHHANGSSSLNVEGRFQNVSMVRMDANGKLVFCVHDTETAKRVVNEQTSTPATAEVK